MVGLLASPIKKESVSKSSAFVDLGFDKDISTKLVNDLSTDKETEANSLGVHLLCTLEASKHFEQFLLIFLRDTCPSVKHCDDDLVLALRFICFLLSSLVLLIVF